MSNQGQRSFRSALAPENLQSIQRGTHNFMWKGCKMWKNPFDFALYWMLIWHAKPRTIIEIGSKFGGSALWFADMLQMYGIEGKVVSVDINQVTTIQDPGNNRGQTTVSHFKRTLSFSRGAGFFRLTLTDHPHIISPI